MNATIDNSVQTAEAAAYEFVDIQPWRSHVKAVTLFAPWQTMHRVTLPILPWRYAKALAEQLALTATDLPAFEGEPHLVLHNGLDALPGERVFEREAVEIPSRHSVSSEDDEEGSPLCRPNNFIRKPAFTTSTLVPAPGTPHARYFRKDLIVLCSLRLRYGQLAKEESAKSRNAIETKIMERSVVPPHERDLWEKAMREHGRKMQEAMSHDPIVGRMKMMEDRIAQLTAENARLQRI